LVTVKIKKSVLFLLLKAKTLVNHAPAHFRWKGQGRVGNLQSSLLNSGSVQRGNELAKDKILQLALSLSDKDEASY
jgi:hypothetical protein